MLNIKHRDIRYQYKGACKGEATPEASPTHKPVLVTFTYFSLASLSRLDSRLLLASILPHLTGDLEDGLSQALDVAGGDTSDGDTAVLGGVDGVLQRKLVHCWLS